MTLIDIFLTLLILGAGTWSMLTQQEHRASRECGTLQLLLALPPEKRDELLDILENQAKKRSKRRRKHSIH